MNSTWTKNLQLFKERFSPLADLFAPLIKEISLADEEEISKLFSFWNVSTAKNGSLTATEKGDGSELRLHSSYNPQREAQSAILQPEIQSKKTVVFMGTGLGYHIIALSQNILDKNEDKKIILIEKDPLHFFAALYYLDWSCVFSISKLVLAIDCPSDAIMGLLEDSSHINTSSSGVNETFFFLIPAFTAHCQPYFDTIKTLIERNKTKNDINAATYDKFAKRWITNSKKNLKYIQNCKKVSDLCADKTLGTGLKSSNFVLIAAGPGLEKLLPKLKEIKEKAVLVCVETALRALLRHGLEPDFIVITDPQYYAYRHIAGLKAPHSTMICPISVYPSVFRFKCKETVLCSDLFPISQFFEKKLGSFGDLGAGGSVASSAWNLCYLLGAKNIFLAGLDLSYPSKETHIRGSSSEQNFHILSGKTKSVEKFSIGSMYSAYPEYGQNYAGRKVLTDSRMKMFAWWFESRIAACPDVKVYSLSKESLRIPGVEAIEPEKMDSFINADPSPIKGRTSDSTSISSDMSLSECIQSYDKELSNLINLVNKAVELCIINSANLEKELSAVENEIAQNPLKEILNLAKPSSKYMEEHKTNPLQLAHYSKLQSDLKLYKS